MLPPSFFLPLHSARPKQYIDVSSSLKDEAVMEIFWLLLLFRNNIVVQTMWVNRVFKFFKVWEYLGEIAVNESYWFDPIWVNE
ncbi:hypothetical protein VNO77_24629 [Canavalia gladiata]|uniref:Uncharacterized protein n=1 Tax=Canavalia gladiata TaxID=3824 RepID=A0AAN9L6Q2_CANGL